MRSNSGGWVCTMYKYHAIKMSSTVTDKMMEERNLFVYIEGWCHVPISCILYEVFEEES